MAAVLATVLAAAPGPAAAGHRPGSSQRFAQATPPGEERGRLRAAEVAVSAGEAAAIAAARTGGRVLDVQLQGGSRPRYRVRVLLGGEQVRTVTVDAVTGEFRG